MKKGYSAMTMKFFNISAEEKIAAYCDSVQHFTNVRTVDSPACFEDPKMGLGDFVTPGCMTAGNLIQGS